MINHRSHLTTLAPNNVWDVKEPTQCSQTIGDVVPGVLVYLYL